MTMKFAAATAALLAAFAPAAVLADTVTLTVPGDGATLQGEAVDMSIYFNDGAEGTYEVVAAYVDDANPTRPQYLIMAMQDGDDVTFALPGHPETLYNFQRTGAILTVGDQTADLPARGNS